MLRADQETVQTFEYKEGTLEEVEDWMESWTDPFEVMAGMQYYNHIDHFQIIPLGEGKYHAVVMYTERPYRKS